jgi:hypothetical protein
LPLEFDLLDSLKLASSLGLQNLASHSIEDAHTSSSTLNSPQEVFPSDVPELTLTQA